MNKYGLYAIAGIVACAVIAYCVWKSTGLVDLARDAEGRAAADSKPSHPLLAEADDVVLATGLEGVGSTATPALSDVIQTVARAGHGGGEPAALTIDYPLESSVFPPDFAAPTFLWHEPTAEADTWLIDVSFPGKSGRVLVLAPGRPPPTGEIDVRCIADTNEIYQPTPYQASARAWTPGDEVWAAIKRHSIRAGADVRISGFDGSTPTVLLSRGTISIRTSRDPVGAPIFYRDVPLAPSETENGRIKPLRADFITLIAWRLRDVSKSQSRLVLDSVPTCANCHSFSADGKTMGMDLDGPDGDKGTYVVAPVERKMIVEDKDVMRWSSFPDKPKGHKTIGFLSRVSPDGRHVISTVNESLYVRNFKDFTFLQVFYPTRGILACYSRDGGDVRALPGADDPRYVHCDAVWAPDGTSLVFARAEAKDPYPEGREPAEFAGDPAEVSMQYDLYRIPFNEGRGGRAEPIAGASDNAMSNTFPKISPDGKWLVFVKCKNGQLLRPDGELWIVPADGGTARRMKCNTRRMNSWHSFSPNGRWLVFSSKANTPYTQMFLTHIDEDGNDGPAILIPNSTAANRAVNLPEFVNIAYDDLVSIDMRALDYRRHGLAGVLMAKQGRVDEALAEFDRAVKKQPDYFDGRMNAALLLLSRGRVDEAKTRLEKLLELNPKYLRARRELAMLLEKQGRTADAILQYKTGLEQNPEFAEAHVKLAQFYIENEEFAKATKHLRVLLALDSKDPLRHLDLALVLMEQGLVEEAVDHMEKSVEIDPGFAPGHFYLGEARLSLGKYAPAVAHFEKAIAADSSHRMAVNRLAWLLAACPDDTIRDGPRAVLLAERACAEESNPNPVLLSTLAAAYAELGWFDEAVRTVSEASRLVDPKDRPLVHRIGRQLESYREGKPYYLP